MTEPIAFTMIACTTIAVTTIDGVRLIGRRWPLPRPRAVVLVVHGFSASSTESNVVALAEHLHTASFEVLAYDARGHGGSGGECTLGDLERHDVAAAIGSARRAGTPLVVAAASMGAIAALHHGSTQPGAIDGLVIVSCPARWRLPRNVRGVLAALMTNTALGRWAARRQLGVRIARRVARPAPPVELIGRIGAPVAVVHGADDPFIDPADAGTLHDAAHEPRRVEIVDGMGHAFPAPSHAPVLRAIDWILDERR